MNWFSKYALRRRIRKTASALGPELKSRYGRSEFYTPGQVKTTAASLKLPADSIWIAYAMFLKQADFDALHPEGGKRRSYTLLRRQIADACFAGNYQFTVLEAAAWRDGGHGGNAGSDSGLESGGDT